MMLHFNNTRINLYCRNIKPANICSAKRSFTFVVDLVVIQRIDLLFSLLTLNINLPPEILTETTFSGSKIKKVYITVLNMLKSTIKTPERYLKQFLVSLFVTFNTLNHVTFRKVTAYGIQPTCGIRDNPFSTQNIQKN